MALPQPLVSILKISTNLGDLRLEAPALSLASFACSHRHPQQRLTPSSDIQNLSYRAFWKLPEAVKISRAKLFGLETQLQHSQVA